jgi:hypothetical protein
VYLNGTMIVLCQDCLDNLPAEGQKTKEIYQKAPHNLSAGLIDSLGPILLGMVVWAAFAFFLQTIAAAISILIFVYIYRSMSNAGTKQTYWSILLAALLSVISVTLGNILCYFLALIRLAYPLNLGAVAAAWQITFSRNGSGILFLSYFFTLLGTGIYMLNTMTQLRKDRAAAFKPVVEIIPGQTKT